MARTTQRLLDVIQEVKTIEDERDHYWDLMNSCRDVLMAQPRSEGVYDALEALGFGRNGLESP